MVRTQIQLTQEQAQLLRARAAQRGVSIAELIRQCVDRLLKEGEEKQPQELRQRAMQASGRFHSGKRDVATRHDEYLGEDFAG